jgi:hypothetical protein
MLRISQPRIISFVRLLGKPEFSRALLEYCALKVERSLPEACRAEKRPPVLASGIVNKNAALKNWHRHSGQNACAIKFLTLRRKLHASSAQFCSGCFSIRDRHPAASSVVAVSRTDRSLVIFREGFGQVAGLVWRQITVATRRYDQSSDHTVRTDYRLLNRCGICSVGYTQFCGN